MSEIVDLGRLPAPDFIEQLDFEAIYQAKLARFLALYPQYTALLESDPGVKLLELAAYDEVTLRARINDAARAVLLPYAGGADLDNLAALLGVERLVVTPADPTAQPPIQAVYEDDERLRLRTQMALEGTTVAGSRGSYVFHALSSDAHVADVAVDSPVPGQVRVTVLSSEGDGTPSPTLLTTVNSYLSAEIRRPLTDTVITAPAELVPFTVTATLYRSSGPEGDLAVPAAQAALAGYLADRRKLGRDVPVSGLFAALHQPGIVRVAITAPAVDLLCDPTQVASCTGITLNVVVSDER